MFIGVTECADPGLDFGWVKNLLPANIIISKNINDRLIKEVLAHKKNIILHVTCTGLGGSVLEKNVPNHTYTYSQVIKLLEAGFPSEQIVLRVDPIIPGHTDVIEPVLEEFEGLVKRCRYSFLDMYQHVKVRFQEANIELPYESFNAPFQLQRQVGEVLKKYDYEYESCAENTSHKLGCASYKDLQILGIKDYQIPSNARQQRSTCSCLPKKQLLPFGTKCNHKCLYCFWKD